MRVLLIEPNSAISQSVELMLKSESFNVYATDLGEEGVDLGKLYDYDAIITEINLPDMSGYEVIRTLRLSKVKTPIIVLTGMPGIEDEVRALGFGADDYIKKPFHKDNLVSRLHTVVRRSKGHAESVITTGNLSVNLDAKQVRINGQPIHLTGKEYQMLELLSLRKGTTLTKEMFLNHLYGGMDEPEIKIIDVFICKLRKKLNAANGGTNPIETVWGRGYVLRDDAEGYVPMDKTADTANNAVPEMTGTETQQQVDTMMQQMSAFREELGLDSETPMEDVLRALKDYKTKAEALLDQDSHGTESAATVLHGEIMPAVSNGDASGDHATGSFNGATHSNAPLYVDGIRMPVGMTFPIGDLLEVDTNEFKMGNTRTGKTVEFDPAVGTILEIMTYYQGKELSKTNLIKAIFENDHKSNEVKLGQFMSQAQASLTQLVGRPFASTIVQVLSGGGYGMPRTDNLVATDGNYKQPAALAYTPVK